MPRTPRLPVVVVFLALLCSLRPASAEVSVPPLFADHMVLQRDMPVPVWGKASPGEEVTVEINGKTEKAKADEKGAWVVRLPELKAGGPHEMTVTGEGGGALTFKDVLVGDVWICSGQSNMEWEMRQVGNEQATKEAQDEGLRVYEFPRTVKLEPSKDVAGQWALCSPEAVSTFSAVGYYFGRELRAKRPDVPVGLIQSAWGGMPAEAFTSKGTLESDPDFKEILQRKAEAAKDIDKKRADYRKAAQEWQKAVVERDAQPVEQFAGAEVDTKDWTNIEQPKPFENIDGAVWLRREVNVPAIFAGRDLILSLGPIDDLDTTYFNGKKVGSTEAENPLSSVAPRQYKVPAELVKEGRNVVAIRVFDLAGVGGTTGQPDQLHLALDGPQAVAPVSLAGTWKMKVERKLDPKELETNKRPGYPAGHEAPNMASNLYNGMIYPIIPYAIKGAIWYQGESNAGRAEQYRELFPAMIEDWRESWDQPGAHRDFPFLFVQLANFKDPAAQPGESDWAELREAQSMTLEASKNTGQAVIIDIGEAKDIHPRNKLDVGKRLALAAEEVAYGKDEDVVTSPTYVADSMKVEDGGKVRLKFDEAGDGLVAKGANGSAGVKGFAIAGEDKQWKWAQAKVEGKDEVVVWSPDVPKPVAVRYGWADNPDQANLFNSAGLPTSPFRTDDWPGVTAGKR